MTPSITFYFQVHQPYRLRDLRITEIGKGDANYFDAEKNRSVFRKVAEKCYLPANRLMLELLERYPNFRIAYSLSGVFLEQCEEYGQDVLASFRVLAKTGRVEFLGETYYHSLSCLKSLKDFCKQVRMHTLAIKRHFGQRPTIFRNTELIYRNELALIARVLGFRGILAEGADRLLGNRSANEPFVPPDFPLRPEQEQTINRERWMPPSDSMHILLKNYRLSDDVAFRFSDRSWVGYPLHADTFTDWLMTAGGHSINLFMDYETFGEHQWEDTGIFEFLRALPRIWDKRGIATTTPSEVIARWTGTSEVYDAHDFISWADTERDLSAWQGNRIQQAALDALYGLEDLVERSHSEELAKIWGRLQTSDHFYYMCTKYWNDGDVHKYFSPYDSPYEAYRRYSHALCDLRQRLEANAKCQVPTSKKEFNHHSSRFNCFLQKFLGSWGLALGTSA
ncbi:alpha-amylase [Candidatus Peregrinibacteria bacterium]|nr:alpha-amylase [Candidatus Peregrinibacteria bacterium]